VDRLRPMLPFQKSSARRNPAGSWSEPLVRSLDLRAILHKSSKYMFGSKVGGVPNSFSSPIVGAIACYAFACESLGLSDKGPTVTDIGFTGAG
jgi:hypothetical protein